MSDPVPPDQVRVSDAERALVETRLRRAVEVGQLELREFDERAALTWAARTRGDLDAVTADLGPLPAPEVTAASRQPDRRDRRPVFSDDAGGTTLRILSIIWLCLLAANLASWVAGSAAAGDVLYFWPVWQLPSGAVLAALYALGIGRPRG